MFNIDWVPFNGLPHRPWLMFFILIFSIIIWGAALFLCIYACYSPITYEDKTLVETTFVAYETSNNDLHLSAPTGETYIITYYNHYNGFFDSPAFLCDGDSYTIWVSDGGFIYSMTNSAGNHFITFESNREAYRNSQKGSIISTAVILLLSITYFATAIVVSKYYEWCPEWLVKLLFKHPSDFLS